MTKFKEYRQNTASPFCHHVSCVLGYTNIVEIKISNIVIQRRALCLEHYQIYVDEMELKERIDKLTDKSRD